jgi:hypothetical protein
MTFEFVPLLRVQRELYALPRSMERFRAYIATMTDADTGDLALPLVAMNPMAKDHVPALLDDYLRLDADVMAAQSLSIAAAQLADVPGAFKVSLVMADDLKGGWTNRYCAEFSHRFESLTLMKRGWLVGLLWTSEAASLDAARSETLAAAFRAAHLLGRPAARTLDEMLTQEGFVMAMAGCTTPSLDPDDLEYTRDVIAAHRGAQDRATIMACLFGDAAARALGYSPQGLSERAGLALALHDGRERQKRR